MLTMSDLALYGAAHELIEVWNKHIHQFTEVQESAIRAGALDGKTNLLVVAPTSSGKTFIGELAATTSAYSQRKHALFIVPFRSLADEHYELFREKYGKLLSVVISTSDWTEFDADIRTGSFNLAVMTYEKLMGFLVHQPDFIRRCTTLVVDEIQSLSDGDRGAKLEILLTQVLLTEDAPQIIGLSASLDDVNQLDRWLRATLIRSTERPIPLTQIVCAPSGKAIEMPPGTTPYPCHLTAPKSDREELLASLTKSFLNEGKQVIVFRSTVKNVLDSARKLRTLLKVDNKDHQLNERLNALDDSDMIDGIQRCLASGIAFHTADLTHPERRIVEDSFRSGTARALIATTTLAMGVNLPSDIVIVADSTRFTPARTGWNIQNISVSEYRNMAGRAGRLGQRTAGHAVLLSKDEAELRQLTHTYLLGDVEPVRSQIPKHAFIDVVFNILCAEITDSEVGIADFITGTFAYLTFYEQMEGGPKAVHNAVRDSVQQCVNSGLVLETDSGLVPTQVAQTFAAAGLSFRSATRLAAAVERMMTSHPSKQDLVFEVASCEETGTRPWPRRRGRVDVDPRPHHAPDGTDCMPGSRLAATLAKQTISTDEMKVLTRTRCLLDWMQGNSTRSISTNFRDMGAAAARVRDLGKYAAHILDALAEATETRGTEPSLTEKLRTLALEARYGLPAPLAPLARLRVPGISREQFLMLYHSDLHNPEVLLDAPETAFKDLLTPLQGHHLRQAIQADIKESLKRLRVGHVARSEQANLPQKLIEDLYTMEAGALEQAVTDALNHAGLSAVRVMRQPNGEEDIRLTHPEGTVIISVTAKQDSARPVRWNKAKEILGAGAGFAPINYVCIGRPGFESLAERSATDIARENGARSILLVPMPVLAEAILRIFEGVADAAALGALLARHCGLLTIEDLPSTAGS